MKKKEGSDSKNKSAETIAIVDKNFEYGCFTKEKHANMLSFEKNWVFPTTIGYRFQYFLNFFAFSLFTIFFLMIQSIKL